MKKISRMLSFFLAVLFTLSSFPMSASAQTIANTPVISLTEFNVVQGEEFVTTAYFEKGSNICQATLTFLYNSEVMDFIGCVENEDSMVSVQINTDVLGQITISFASGINISAKLSLVDMRFKVKENLVPGKYEFLALSESNSFVRRMNSNNIAESVSTSFSPVPLNIYEAGDINLDGFVDGVDAVYILRYIAGLDSGSEEQDFYLPYYSNKNLYTERQKFMLKVADAYYDNEISGSDAVTVLRHEAGFNEILGNRVIVSFFDVDGGLAAERSVVIGKPLMDVPSAGTDKVWSLSSQNYVEVDFSNVQTAFNAYAVENVCAHNNMDPTEAKAATCTEPGNHAYWHCADCGKYFSDENGNTEITLADTVIAALGHTEVEIPAVAPTYDKEGSTPGVKCSVCDVVIIQPETTEPLKPDEVSILYKYDTIAGDEYLPTAIAKALADGKIITQEIKDVTNGAYTDLPFINNETIPGYEFQGWYNSTASDAEKITFIAQGTTGNITLYAKWKKTEYTVTLKSPLKSIPTINRTIDQTTLLPSDKDMEVPNYYFMGWSDGTGKIVDQISPGIGNITVYANWTSATRNIAYAEDYKNQTPIIIEPDKAGDSQYLFVYNIGYIDRVPVAVIEDSVYNSGTYKYIVESFESSTIRKGQEKEINSTIANATTHSSSWTLSEEWNELITEVNGKEQSMEQGKVVAISDGSSKAYSSSASTYSGNSFHSSNDSFVSSKTITDDSYNNSASVEAGLSYGPAKVSAKISGEQAHSDHQEDYSESKSSLEVSADWNETKGYSVSGESFVNSTKTESILEAAKNTWGLEISKALTDTEARTDAESSSTTSTEGHKSIIAFHNEETKGNSTTIERTFTEVGHYRYAMFAKVHVFAVVGFDMETGSYFVNTYSVVDDTMTYDFDYSSDGSYKDYDNAVLPFEVPVFVYDYIFENNAKTEGVVIGRDGIVKEYTGDATNVRIPDYATFDNEDGAYLVVPVVGIVDGLFENKTNIESVKLGEFITSIPNNAFKGCTSLKKLEYNAEILTSIGDHAFEGCTSLNSMEIGDSNKCNVTNIGVDAFKNIPSVKIYAVSADVAEKAIACGANDLSVYMKHLSDSEIAQLSGKTLKVGETTTSFSLYGADKIYNNLSVESNAKRTVINGMTFDNNTKTPLTLESNEVEFNRLNISNASGIAILFKAPQTAVTIKSVNNISTRGNTAILGKNISISKTSGEYSEFNVANGDFIVCGEIDALISFAYLDVVNGEIRSISDTEYKNMLKTHTINFDPNGGTVMIPSTTVTYGFELEETPIPEWNGYTFLGWFDENGIEVRAGDKIYYTEDITLKARWKSGYVLESSIPNGAEIVSGSEKWTYDLTTNITSDKSSVDGYTLYDTTFVWGETVGPLDYDPSNGVRNVWSEEYVSSTTKHYKYYHWTNGSYFNNYQYSSDYSKHSIDLTYTLNYFETGSTGIDWYKGYTCSHCGSKDRWAFEGTYDEDHYSTEWYYKEPIYTYYFTKKETMESTTEISETENISNVQKWVQYIIY